MKMPYLKPMIALLLLFAACSQAAAGVIVSDDRSVGLFQIDLSGAQTVLEMAANESERSPVDVEATLPDLSDLCVVGDSELGFNAPVGIIDQVFFAAKPVCVEHVDCSKGPNLPVGFPLSLLKVPIDF